MHLPLRERYMKVRILFGLIALLFITWGVVGLIFMFIQPMMRYFDIKNWTETPCTVISAETRVETGTNSSKCYVDITYEYEVDGITYRSERYSLTEDLGLRSVPAAKKIVKKYRRSANSICYVNPQKPSEAALNANIKFLDIIIGLGTLFFVYIGWYFVKCAIEKDEDEAVATQQVN
jgi:hypothetical protein